MPRQPEHNTDRYNDILPTKIRELLESSQTTYKALGEAVGVRQQTVSQYASGQTQPTAEVVLKIAEYFNVSVDYLLRGVSSERQDIHEKTGLSDKAISLLQRTKDIHTFDGKVTDGEMLDKLLSDEDFYHFFDELLFKAALTKSTLEMTDEQRQALKGMDLEGYYIWDLQMFIQDFIQKELRKLGVSIEMK